jgi:hypothetical protein
MFLKKKFHPNPRGVPLDELQRVLSTTTLKISREAESLIAEHETAVTKVTVIPPARDEVGNDPIQAVVQVTTDLPGNFPRSLVTPESLMTLNQMAVLGALTVERDRCFIGSRLTVFEQEQAWNLYFPFLISTVIAGADAHLGALQTIFGNKEANREDSVWTEADFSYVRSKLSEFCVCTEGGLGLTAEFGLRPSATIAASGHHMTALWQLKAEEPHPELGGGLLCVLHMPHRVTRERLADILQDLNHREMAPRDQPPHFGAWCGGHLENTLAYVSFLPNFMHSTVGIALNVSIWAFHRAHWADAYLASIGVHL